MSDRGDTIYARASGAGLAAVAVLRLSGPDAAEVLRAFVGILPKPRQASLRPLRHPATAETIDRGLVLWMPGPRSYTGEDCVEFHLHGSSAVMSVLCAAVGALGCRPAEPGEFTRRAFLHGKLDLTQAEGIADLIAAQTSAQRRQALRQADGALARIYAAWTERAKRILAHEEAGIEFELDDLPTDLRQQAALAASSLAAEITAHLSDSRRGERLREGLSVVIVGAPNVGKSSLLNALAGRDAAIVSPQPGTTRDVVEVRLDLGGVAATLSDTAGLRDTSDGIEREGVRRARAAAATADLVIAAFAADTAPDEATLAIATERPDVILVNTKCDLRPHLSASALATARPTSAYTGDGIAALRAALVTEAERRAGLSDAPLLTRERHRAALREAAEQLTAGATAHLPELAAEAYRSTILALGRLTGQVGVENILDIVFGDFCIGK